MPTLHAPTPAPTATGFGLAEALCVLALTAIGAAWGLSSWQVGVQKAKVQAAREGFVHGLQWARIQAIQQGVDLQLVRATDCTGLSALASDWRCGWQVLPVAGDLKPLRTHALSGDVLVLIYPANNQLPINGHGETVAGGLRVTVQAKHLKTMVRSICINNTGRMRVVAAEVCT
jgi:Tfp pilus assembly protein FimT